MTARRLLGVVGLAGGLCLATDAEAQAPRQPAPAQMADKTTSGYAPTTLPRTIPIFPLPDVMLFPGATRPLHVFEARYREMVADALAGDRLIGMVMLRPGHEDDYAGRPPIHPVGCVGVIAEATELPDGRYNILLGGLTKFRVLREDDSRAYRLADIEPISDAISPADRSRLRDVRQDLAALIPLGIPGLQVPDDVDDEDLVNGIAQLIDIAPADRLGLLEQPGPLARAEALIDLIYIRSALRR